MVKCSKCGREVDEAVKCKRCGGTIVVGVVPADKPSPVAKKKRGKKK